MKNFVKNHALLVGGVGIGIACLLVLGMVLSCALFFMITWCHFSLWLTARNNHNNNNYYTSLILFNLIMNQVRRLLILIFFIRLIRETDESNQKSTKNNIIMSVPLTSPFAPVWQSLRNILSHHIMSIISSPKHHTVHIYLYKLCRYLWYQAF